MLANEKRLQTCCRQARNGPQDLIESHAWGKWIEKKAD
jgi:hypothetical protein